jgi:hypothetical protein
MATYNISRVGSRLQSLVFFTILLAGSGGPLKPWAVVGASVSDDPWDRGFYFLGSGFGQTVAISALAQSERGELFVGGTFNRLADSMLATNIARFDGTNWFPLGSGVNGPIKAIALRGSEVFVGGTFTSAGGGPATNVARWDGTNWWAVGEGIIGTVSTMLFAGQDLYVGGKFTMAGGVSAQHIAKWDNHQWSTLNGGFAGPNAEVKTLLQANNGEVIAGGIFTTASGNPLTNIARWDAAAWKSVGTGLSAPLYTLTQDRQGRIYAGGGLTVMGSPYIAVWNGITWSNMSPGSLFTDDPVGRLFVWEDELYACGIGLPGLAGLAGRPGVSKWTGTNWVSLGAPFYLSTIPLVIGPEGFYVAGRLDNVMSPSVTGTAAKLGLAKYSGGGWSIVGAGLCIESSPTAFVRSLLVVGDDVIAAGHFHGENSSFGERTVARWNGKIWSAMSPQDNGSQWGRCDRCAAMALGYFQQKLLTGGYNDLTAAVFDGAHWLKIPTPSPVRAIAVTDSVAYLGGDFGIQGWDGQNLLPLGAGINGPVFALVMQGDKLFAGGTFSVAGEAAASNIARWDGTNWSALGAGLDSSVNALALRGFDLIAGGSFTNAGAIKGNCIAVWDGTNWTSLGAGFSEGQPQDNFFMSVPTSVNALAVTVDGLIYAAGNFTKADQNAANFISYWAGDGWQPMGSGLNRIAYALALKGDDLYVGGDFTQAGGRPSSRLALWRGNPSMRAPRLQVTRTGDNIILSWRASAVGYALEGASQPTEPSWTSIAFEVFTDRHYATNSASGRNQYYYRLRK